MEEELNSTFFTQYGKYYSPHHTRKNAVIPFKEHPQFPILVDILIRKYHHHALLAADFPMGMIPTFLEAFLQYLTQESVPHQLRNIELIPLDIETKIKQKTLEKDFHGLREILDNTDKYLLIVLTHIDVLIKRSHQSDDHTFLRRQLETLLTHPKCRFLLVTNGKDYKKDAYFDDHFTSLHLSGPTEIDVMTILKQQREELESYHKVVIPEELLEQAYALSERFLSTNHTLEKTLLLLDSGAARAALLERLETNNQFKPILTSSVLTQVLAGWTHIPATQLSLNKFKLTEFIQGMQQKVFGQDAAITVIGHDLQQVQAQLHPSMGPFCSLLFVGAPHTGKETMALALVEQLFKQLDMLYLVQQPSPMVNTLTDIKIKRLVDNRYFALKDIIQQTPYAVIMFENIDQANTMMLEGIQEILTTGFSHDDHGNQFNFRQSIIILSTTAGSERLADFAKTLIVEDDIPAIDLMQLVMSEQKHEPMSEGHIYSPQELTDKVITHIAPYLPQSLYQNATLVPFMPLNKHAIEKIIRLKLKLLAKQLDNRYGIELAYAPEITRYLAQEVLMKYVNEKQTVDIEKSLRQLYFSIEQAILSQADNKNRPNQLFLQLNETGQVLRCDWLAITDLRQHAN